ncbi:hypothetical protein KAFR_0G01410 [Kazachstania africana CBS 2517]|uniref:Small ribosomal subunit protein uS9m n=1 Tax=Kazachstania africana (strain ATCC 22294 / BCRC 22015 / CBS 2517 / CECT 1963 / NBRC 1671 / NRRL Y-8276) TaxID=1071382 RepID=H2AXS5_KAZAF|nr:hypothetical protein KAFR_0G01410 [Kazachstania africana CBS 2517]CCF59175.1 hypothetical protein KAFR_0G01410 [Kazachstania africana CBS 2517]
MMLRRILFESRPLLVKRSFSQYSPLLQHRYTKFIPDRIVPELPTFYSANPPHEDNIARLEALLRKYIKLPTETSLNGSTPDRKRHNQPLWISLEEYRAIGGGSRLKPIQYKQLLYILNKLNGIDPQLTNEELKIELSKYSRNHSVSQAQHFKVPTLDEFGRSLGVGRRKSATAKVYIVKGTGQVLVNNRQLNDYFVKLKDRASILHPLKAIDSVGKFNIFAMASGGGTTGQAEAIMLAVGKALVAFNPLLKSRLHKAGVLTTDYRRVERKKPGKRKARKMPAWVKR